MFARAESKKYWIFRFIQNLNTKKSKKIFYLLKHQNQKKTKEKENARNFKYSNQKLFGTIQVNSNCLVDFQFLRQFEDLLFRDLFVLRLENKLVAALSTN